VACFDFRVFTAGLRYCWTMSDQHFRDQRPVVDDLSRWAGFDSELTQYLDEIAADRDLILGLERQVKDEPFFRTKSWPNPLHLGVFRVVLYVLLRRTKPELVIETGILHGLTSAFMLRALDRNGTGRLISIDLPSYLETGPSNQDGFQDTLPAQREPGWVVAPDIRRHWEIKIGKSVDMLPAAIGGKEIGLFLHDSEHTYSTMWSEFNLAWPALTEGGFLVCDNLDCNTSFFDFARRVNRMPFIVSEKPNEPIRFGVMKK
jgi:Methyltransferase domain